MEIFTGVYEIKVPNHKEKDGKKAAVNEIHTDTIRLRSNGSNEEETATITLRAPNRYVQCMQYAELDTKVGWGWMYKAMSELGRVTSPGQQSGPGRC